MKIPIVGEQYTAYADPISGQKCVNWYPEFNPTGRGNPDGQGIPYSLIPTPGSTDFLNLGGKIRGMNRMGGVNYIVSGATLYSMTDAGTATSLGSIAGTGRCGMANDGTNVVIVNGTEGYVYNGTTLAQITDPDFYASDSVDFLDGYMTFVRTGTGQSFWSDAYDPTSFDGLSFITAEGAPDDTKAQAVADRLLYLFGENTIEIWQNTGGISVFSRVDGAFLEKGIKAKYSVAKLDENIFWLADDGMVYQLRGYEYVNKTPPGIANQINTAANPENAYAFTYIQDGHAFYVLTFDEFTLCYDITTGKWHERASWNGTQTRWKVNHYLKAGNIDFVGFEDGNIRKLDNSYRFEGTDSIVRDRITTDLTTSGKRTRQGSAEVKFASGVGLNTGQGSDPQVMLRVSDDGGMTWGNEKWRSIGKIGEYAQRVIWRRLGSFYQRRFWLRVSDPVNAVVIDAWGDFS